ncbi:MAG: DUF4190 domain-containing protein [Acidobacteriota bacterium]|nr:DUF4190 domain-containing protein [Acidobacteriota bacterium]
MKKCPTCDKEFPDSMRFCQTDGTLLVEKQNDPPIDPYKTVVGNQSDIAAAIPPADPLKTMMASPPPKKADDDILQIPAEPDSMKTLVVSHDELQAGMKANDIEGASPLDLPPPASYAPSAPLIEPKPKMGGGAIPPPKFGEPFPAAPNFGDASASNSENAPANAANSVNDTNDAPPNPPSPFDSKPFENDFSGNSPYGNQENKPIPSPFDLSMPPGYLPPSMNPFNEPPKPVGNFDEPKSPSPFDAPPTPFGNAEPFNQPLQPAEWTPPPAPDASWQNQEIGANTPFQPPVAGQGLNQTLPIVSLVLGIISLCCYTGWLTGPAALITGYLGFKNIKNNPNQYGGKGLALAGMITGGIFTLIWIIYWIFIIIVYAGLFAGGAFSR